MIYFRPIYLPYFRPIYLPSKNKVEDFSMIAPDNHCYEAPEIICVNRLVFSCVIGDVLIVQVVDDEDKTHTLEGRDAINFVGILRRQIEVLGVSA